MVSWQKVDLVNPILFVIVEYFHVFIFQQIQIDLVSVVANAHHKSPLQVERFDLLVQRQLTEFFPTHFWFFYLD